MSPEALSELISSIAHNLVAAGQAGALTDELIPPVEKLAVMRPKDRAHGDWASNIAMQLAKKAGMKALIITHIGALGLYLGAAIVFAHTGTFAITAIAGLDAKLKAIVLLLVLFAAWAKSAQVPMYMWLPSAMEAPTPSRMMPMFSTE